MCTFNVQQTRQTAKVTDGPLGAAVSPAARSIEVRNASAFLYGQSHATLDFAQIVTVHRADGERLRLVCEATLAL